MIFSGDFVGLAIAGRGMIVTPPTTEPVPEDHERISHLRVSKNTNILENDFHRIFFKVVSENQVHFSIVLFTFIDVSRVTCRFLYPLSTSNLQLRMVPLYDYSITPPNFG